MAYKQKGCSPITAKLKRTTKGGMVQDPLLNVGSVAKMKGDLNKDSKMSGYETARQTAIDKSMSSPAKQDKKYLTKTLEKRALAKERKAYESAKKQYNLNNSRSLDSFKPTTQKSIKRSNNKFESQYGARYKGEAGWAADDAARKNKTGLYAPKLEKTDTTKTDTPKTTKTDNAKTTKRTSYDTAYKNRDMKTYGKMDKATYIKEAKRQNASKKAGKGWDTKNKAKAKDKVTPPRKKAVALDPMKTKPRTTIKPKAKEVSKAKANKLTRAAGVRAKGEAALASGNVRKARRLKRREERIKKRAARK